MHEPFIIIVLGGGLAVLASRIRRWHAAGARNDS
jgi:hypothetical protein